MSENDDNVHCRMLPDYRVVHWDCSLYVDGTVTSVLTGDIENESGALK